MKPMQYFAIVAVVVVALVGCAPQLVAVRGESTRDGVKVAFCGSERLKEGTNTSVWMPGGGVGWGSSTTDTGQTEICLTVTNDSDGALVVDRRLIRLQADGYRGALLADGQDRRWKIKSGEEESLTLAYDTSSLDRGDKVVVIFKGALLIDGVAIKMAPLRLSYH